MMFAAMLAAAAGAIECGYSGFYGVYADIHDGDMKKWYQSADSKTMYIEPYNNTETWKVIAAWNTKYCNGSVDFNVPGKPNPPPVPITMTYYLGFGRDGQSELKEFVFTDPTGTLGKPGFPLNTWLLIDSGPAPMPSHGPRGATAMSSER